MELKAIKTKKAFIDYLHYELGHQWTNFFLTSTFLKDGQPCFTKWRSYLDIQGDEKALARVNQRTLLINEVALEYDGESKIYDILIDILKKNKIEFYAYSTDKKRAKHIHLFFDRWFALLPKHKREEYREALIEKYQCDKMLKTERHMIALEHCPHWKTGQKKELIAYG